MRFPWVSRHNKRKNHRFRPVSFCNDGPDALGDEGGYHYLGNGKDQPLRLVKSVSDFDRGFMWKLWANVDGYRSVLPANIYSHLLSFDFNDFDPMIRKDIRRTFPNNLLFQKSARMQKSLFNVLRAFALYSPEVGYSQGMAFIAGLLLLHMEEEDAFFTMISIMEKHDTKALFQPESQRLDLYCLSVELHLRKKMKPLYAHMTNLEIPIHSICTQWFLTLFTYNISLDTAAKIWDEILKRDDNMIPMIASRILRILEPLLLKAGQEEIQSMMKDLSPYLPPGKIIQEIGNHSHAGNLLPTLKSKYLK